MWRRSDGTALIVAGVILAARPATADFVELEKLLESPATDLAEKLARQTAVVAVRGASQTGTFWNIAQAAGVELTAALRKHDIDALRAAGDTRWEKLEAVDHPFTAREAKSLKQGDRQVLIGVEWFPAKRPRLKITAFGRKAPKALWTKVIDVPEAALSQESNIPPMNRSVVQFAKGLLGKPARDGDCAQLAEECLRAAGAGKRGIYLWGRELGPREPWLPGDILQMEKASVNAPGLSRTLGHHTAVVEEVRVNELVVLHQNAFPDGKVVQRDVWPIGGMRGEIVAYRPWNWPEKSPFPPACPRRASPAFVVQGKNGKAAKSIDLLKLVDPRLDRVQGIWFFENDGLRSHREFVARLQFPLAPPRSYVLRMSVERIEGVDQLGIGVIVGGRQTMLSIDGYDSKFTGIHNLDAKPANDNESTKAGSFLPLKKRTQIECRVSDEEIVLEIDRTPVIEWRGDPARLSLSPDWPVPHADWLFISCHDSSFDVSSFTLEPFK
ncbi:MAG TPA: CHAP domain-containing protein [Pirellulales bacterium]|nr:CHAP domain-containing protein [Pirellulales bacterium]